MAVSKRRKLKTLIIGTLKDKASIAKALALLSPARVAVIRATAHGATSPPPERRVAAVLSRGGECADALAARLRGTGSAAVALKCLAVAHTALSRGSAAASAGVRSSLNLSAFRDRSGGGDTWRLSAWVRWYGLAVEESLAVSRVTGNNKVSPSFSSSSKLLSELDALANYAERASEAPAEPSSPSPFIEIRKNGLVYEVLRLVGEDYKLVQREISARAKELGERIKGTTNSLSFGELTLLVGCLKRLEDCKERLVSIFLSRKRDDEFWGLIGRLRIEAVEVTMIEKRLLMDGHEMVNKGNSTGFFNNPFVEPGRLFLFPSSNGLSLAS